MDTNVTCPKCGEHIELTQALIGDIEHSLTEKYQKEIANARKQTEIEVRKKIEEKSVIELQDLKKQLKERDTKVEQMRSVELKLREEKRKIEEKEKELELEIVRRIDVERKKIEQDIGRKSQEEHRLKEKEKDKIIDDLKKALDDAQRKAHQQSQQLQGEVQELDLEEILHRTFTNDTIEPVGKGVRGADIRQIVKSPKGTVCGVILWESKRTKQWSNDWLQKLKSDLRHEKANIPVIVTSTLPKDTTSSIVFREGVWICTYEIFLPLATLLRKNLLDVTYQKLVSAHKGEKADLLYEYITSHEFRQQVEALVEVYHEMHQHIIKERASFERSWKVREQQIKRLMTSTANIYGSMQGLAGSSMQQVKGLELQEGFDESEHTNSLPLLDK
ncbi:DUF2130 domain-containing protein [Patescibacteria group bacterium]